MVRLQYTHRRLHCSLTRNGEEPCAHLLHMVRLRYSHRWLYCSLTRNGEEPCAHLLHLVRLRYSHRWLYCSLTRNGEEQCAHLLHLVRLRYSHRWLHCSLTRNTEEQYAHLLHLVWLSYSHRWLYSTLNRIPHERALRYLPISLTTHLKCSKHRHHINQMIHGALNLRIKWCGHILDLPDGQLFIDLCCSAAQWFVVINSTCSIECWRPNSVWHRFH